MNRKQLQTLKTSRSLQAVPLEFMLQKIGDDSLTVSRGCQDITINVNQSQSTGMKRKTSIGSNDSLTVGVGYSLSAGLSIQLLAAGSFIMMSAASITIASPIEAIIGVANIDGGPNVMGPPLINGSVPMPSPV